MRVALIAVARVLPIFSLLLGARSAVAETPATTEASVYPPKVVVPEDVHVGTGYHPFNHWYLMTGVNWALSPCGSTVTELETSLPYVFHNSVWFGGWGALGFRAPRSGHDKNPCGDLNGKRAILLDKSGARAAVGLELGWRMFGGDFGYVYDQAVDQLQTKQGHGMRGRFGVSLTDELFTSGFARYSRNCCNNGCPDPKRKAEEYSVPCECERTPVGLSLFVYYGVDYFPAHGNDSGWVDHLFGLSLKVAAGL